jgi:GTP 3',8-cyclase
MNDFKIDGHKLFWHLDRVLAWQRGETVAPIYLEVSPVSYCNHQCIFCGIDFIRDTAENGARLERDLFCRRLEEMGALGVRSLMFAGEGEPLLHKDLPLFIHTAKAAGIDVSLTTNGSIGRAGLWAECLPDLTWIRFSVDAGTPETYARVHGVRPDAFAKTVANIKAAVALKQERNLPVTVGVQFLMLPENRDDLDAALALFTAAGVDYIALKAYSLHPQMVKKTDLDYSEELLAAIEKSVAAYTGKSRTQVIFRRDSMETYHKRAKGYEHCRALPFWGYITARGDFYTCSVFIGREEFRAGNVNEQPLREIFFGAKRRESLCYGACELNVEEHCRVNCRMARINEFLEFLSRRPDHVNFI